jgi:hypothetical protein
MPGWAWALAVAAAAIIGAAAGFTFAAWLIGAEMHDLADNARRRRQADGHPADAPPPPA